MAEKEIRLDAHGQPVNRRLNAARLQQRGVDELIGLCAGMLSDGVVAESEAKFLLEWLNVHHDVGKEWPGNVLYARVYEFLRDGSLNQEERKELLDLLSQTCGLAPDRVDTTFSAGTVFDTPQMQIDNRTFALTGQFVFGTRFEVEEEIKNLGGWVDETLFNSTDFLLVGTIASRDWRHATFGALIEDAIFMRNFNGHLRIISEDWWAKHIFS